MKLNNHNFDFLLPLFPYEGDTVIRMDGRNLQGVTGLNIKAGANGYTHVAIEFEARCAVQFAGHLVAEAGFGHSDDMDLRLAELYRRAQAEIGASLEQDSGEDEHSYTQQAALVRRVVSMLIEEFK